MMNKIYRDTVLSRTAETSEEYINFRFTENRIRTKC